MIFEEMGQSIWKPAAYADFARQKAGRAVLYLVLISLPLAVTGALRLGSGWNMVMEVGVAGLGEAPEFRLVGGVLEFDGPQPYYLYDDSGRPIGVVDTTGAVDRSILDGKDQFLLVLGDRILLRDGTRTEEVIYAQTPLTDLTKADLLSSLRVLKGLGFVLGLAWLISSVAAKMFAALVLALVTWAVAASRRRSITFGGSWSLAAHALTLSLLLGFARSLFSVTIHYFGLIYWGAALVYAVVATGLLPPSAASETPEQEPPRVVL